MEQSRARLARPPVRASRGWLPLAWLPLLLVALCAPLEAQLSGEEMAVVRAALPHLREGLPAGRAALDPEAFCEPRLVGWDCPGPLRETAESLGFRLSGRTFVHVCLRGRCRLVGTQSLVVLSPPEISGRSATLDARVWERAGSDSTAIDQRRFRLRLSRGSGGWEVTGEEPLPGG